MKNIRIVRIRASCEIRTNRSEFHFPLVPSPGFWRIFMFTFGGIIFERNLRSADKLEIASANAKNRNQINLSKY